MGRVVCWREEDATMEEHEIGEVDDDADDAVTENIVLDSRSNCNCIKSEFECAFDDNTK